MAATTHAVVLGEDAVVLHGHLESGEGDHASAQLGVDVVEWGLFQGVQEPSGDRQTRIILSPGAASTSVGGLGGISTVTGWALEGGFGEGTGVV